MCIRDSVNSLVYTGVGIVGALSVVGGGLSVGQLSAFLSYANQYTKPFNEISGVVTELQNALADVYKRQVQPRYAYAGQIAVFILMAGGAQVLGSLWETVTAKWRQGFQKQESFLPRK